MPDDNVVPMNKAPKEPLAPLSAATLSRRDGKPNDIVVTFSRPLTTLEFLMFVEVCERTSAIIDESRP